MPVPVEHARIPALVLRLGLAGMGLGIALHDLRYDQGPLLSTLLGDLGWPEARGIFVHRAGAWVCLVGGLAVALTRRAWPLLLLVGTWMVLRMATALHQTEVLPEVVPFAKSLRWVSPFAVALLLSAWRTDRVGERSWNTALTLIRLATAATFAAHGLEAWHLHPPFQDLLTIAGERLLGVELATETVHRTLRGIAILDWVVATLVLTTRWVPVALWMAFWGLITALSRVVHSGLEGVADALLRTPHVTGPLALAIVWRIRNAAQVLDWTAGTGRP